MFEGDFLKAQANHRIIGQSDWSQFANDSNDGEKKKEETITVLTSKIETTEKRKRQVRVVSSMATQEKLDYELLYSSLKEKIANRLSMKKSTEITSKSRNNG